jgi:hypothetical protein
MLLVGTKAQFLKKARGRIEFICAEGLVAVRGVEACMTKAQGTTFELSVIGKDNQGDIVAQFEFQWSVKVRDNP